MMLDPLAISLPSVAFAPSCTVHSQLADMNEMRGVPAEYQATTSGSLQGLIVERMIGNGSKASAIDEFTKEAAARRASRTRITSTTGLTYLFNLRPLPFFIHPVQATVEGNLGVE